jgi:tRNA A-37 threonylcarbamoyl transferase component Bud32
MFGPATSEESLGTLANYEIHEVLGYGGMGIVFRAFDQKLRRPVAIKVLNQDLAASRIARRRFIREARAAAAINHANVVTIYAVEEEHDPPLISMELVHGKSLSEYLRERQHLDPIETLRISEQIADGLAAAHGHGVIHRDIKPGNIMLEEGVQRVKLTDFGLARVAVDNVELTSDGHTLGTPAYMAPEQVLGATIDARADLFALGCVMYAMLTGHSPFYGQTALQIANRVTEWNPPPLSESHPAVPPFLAELVCKLLAKSPGDRFQSAVEVGELINAHLAMINQTPTDKLVALSAGKGTWPAPAEKRAERKEAPWKLLLSAVVGVVAIVAVAAALILREPVANETRPTSPPQGEVATVASNPEVPRRELTVSKSGDSDFDSIGAALARAGPGTVIRVQDDAEYNTPIVINDEARWSGLQLIAEDGAFLRATDAASVISIHATSGVVVDGFRMDVGLEQHGINITGPCPGIKIQNLNIQRSDDPTNTASLALIYLHAGAMGTEELPILIERVIGRDGNIGIFVGTAGVTDIETDAVTGWIEVRECDFVAQNRLMGYHLILASRIENVRVAHNLFSTAACGVSLSLPEATYARNVTIEHNTFYDLKSLLVLNGANLAQDGLRFQHNLAYGDTEPLFDGELTDLPPNMFEANYWLAWPGTSAELDPIATPLSGFDFIATNPANSDYLRIKQTLGGEDPPAPFPGRYELPQPVNEKDLAEE